MSSYAPIQWDNLKIYFNSSSLHRKIEHLISNLVSIILCVINKNAHNSINSINRLLLK